MEHKAWKMGDGVHRQDDPEKYVFEIAIGLK
jgi:hypothetical protein